MHRGRLAATGLCELVGLSTKAFQDLTNRMEDKILNGFKKYCRLLLENYFPTIVPPPTDILPDTDMVECLQEFAEEAFKEFEVRATQRCSDQSVRKTNVRRSTQFDPDQRLSE